MSLPGGGLIQHWSVPEHRDITIVVKEYRLNISCPILIPVHTNHLILIIASGLACKWLATLRNAIVNCKTPPGHHFITIVMCLVKENSTAGQLPQATPASEKKTSTMSP